MDLTLYHAEISQVLQIIHHLFNIEGAVFDDSAVLVTGSKGYLERKGTAVHKPSIMEVIENGEVIVLRPGEMRSCIGCRFSGNCPATLELLKRIVIDGTPVGVLSFSAFSESAHDRIAEQMDYFERIMVDFSDLLAMLIKNAHAGDTSVFEKQFAALTSLVSEGLLVTNARGEITACNAPALAMLSGSCLTSIHDFLPPELSAEVLSPQPVQNRSVSLRPDCELTITSVPILGADGSSEGAALRLSAKSGPILPPTRHVDASRMRGSGTQMASVRRRMNKILNSPSSVYISGETGTGKGLLARAIHYESNRRDKPFVIISCANIPETLFESELFGYEGGAFTGALKSGKQGKMELAEGGTLFLDEISEMPMSMQAKLLTVLQDRQFERVGGTRPIPLNTRIISASNADIRQRIAEGRFRADLFYRLNVIDMEMCPLRERLEDLPELLDAFLQKFNHQLGAAVEGFSDEVLALFRRYSWPGNVRQLENIVEYCVNMAEGSIVQPDDLPPSFLRELEQQPLPALKEAEGSVIRDLLNQYGWDSAGKARAAQALGISVRTLYRKMEQAHLTEK